MSRRVKTGLAIVLGIGLLSAAGWYFTGQIRKGARMSAIRRALADRDLPLANTLLENRLRDDDDDAEAHLLAARTARRLDDFPAANRHLNRFRELDGDPDEVAMELILRGSQSGNLSGAAGALKLCVEQPDNPSVPMMIEALTRGYLAADRPRLAEEATDVWLKRNPPPGDRAYALYLRGRAVERQGKIPDALATYRESLALRPRSPECALALAEVLSREAPPEALPMYDRLRDEGYKPTEVALGTARCLRGLGELDRAAGLVAPLETAQPANVAVLVEAAKIALDKLRPADAERRLRAALAIAPKHRDANVQLARCLRDLGRDADARVQSEVVRRLDAELDGKAP